MPAGDYVTMRTEDGEKGRECAREGADLHFHNFMEIGMCRAGEGELVLGSRTHPFFAGMFSVIPPNYPHDIRPRASAPGVGSWEFLFVDVGRFLKDIFADKPKMAEELSQKVCQRAHILSCGEHARLGGAIRELAGEMRCREPYFRERVRGLLLAMLVEVARLLHPQGAVSRQGMDQAGDPVKIGGALQYVGAHYGETIHIEMLARRCGLSETHFRRMFRKVMDMSPQEYVNLVRIQTACKLLESTDATVEEIAMKTGFISMATFNRNFKKLIQVTPHQWRRQPAIGHKAVWPYPNGAVSE